jgi:hypothetical protein
MRNSGFSEVVILDIRNAFLKSTGFMLHEFSALTRTAFYEFGDTLKVWFLGP